MKVRREAARIDTDRRSLSRWVGILCDLIGKSWVGSPSFAGQVGPHLLVPERAPNSIPRTGYVRTDLVGGPCSVRESRGGIRVETVIFVFFSFWAFAENGKSFANGCMD